MISNPTFVQINRPFHSALTCLSSVHEAGMHCKCVRTIAAQLRQEEEPCAVVLSCSDSRVPPELVFDQGLGDIYVVRQRPFRCLGFRLAIVA